MPRKTSSFRIVAAGRQCRNCMFLLGIWCRIRIVAQATVGARFLRARYAMAICRTSHLPLILRSSAMRACQPCASLGVLYFAFVLAGVVSRVNLETAGWFPPFLFLCLRTVGYPMGPENKTASTSAPIARTTTGTPETAPASRGFANN